MYILLILLLLSSSGLILFSKFTLSCCNEPYKKNCKVSIIIPARNEEKNIQNIMESLKKQTYKPYEIIVVDDSSSDRTFYLARQYGAKVIKNTKLPEGWIGKNWAVWNGFLKSTGDILVFLDADVTLAPNALEALIKTRDKVGGTISVVPYHKTGKFYEKLSLLPYLLGVFAFTSPFERKNYTKGLYGACIVTSREDYDKIKGHSCISSELLDDLNLGKKLSEAGVNVENFIGDNLVSFRMYPNGIGSELQGFGKGAALSTATLRPETVMLIALWVIGLLSVELITPYLIVAGSSYIFPFTIGYLIYTVQIMYLLKHTGNYGYVMPFIHVLSSIFFIIIILYSIYQVTCIGSVSWKGRQIKIGGKSK